MLKLPAYMVGFSSRSDGSAGIRFATQEISATEFSVLKQNLNEFGWLLFTTGVIKESDIPQEDPLEDDQKSPSKRLKAVLFLLWKKTGEKDDFTAYYRRQMEKMIEKVKEKLD